jgi:hypothetical protein
MAAPVPGGGRGSDAGASGASPKGPQPVSGPVARQTGHRHQEAAGSAWIESSVTGSPHAWQTRSTSSGRPHEYRWEIAGLSTATRFTRSCRLNTLRRALGCATRASAWLGIPTPQPCREALACQQRLRSAQLGLGAACGLARGPPTSRVPAAPARAEFYALPDVAKLVRASKRRRTRAQYQKPKVYPRSAGIIRGPRACSSVMERRPPEPDRLSVVATRVGARAKRMEFYALRRRSAAITSPRPLARARAGPNEPPGHPRDHPQWA